MITFKLSDLNAEALRAAAKRLGIDDGLNKSDIEVKIRERVAADDDALVFGSSSKQVMLIPQNPAWRTIGFWTLLVYVATMFFVAWSSKSGSDSAVTALAQLNANLSRQAEEDRKTKVRDWQQVIVFKLVEDEGGDTGVGFKDILSKYTDKALTVEGIDFKKEELQDLALQRILTDLLVLGLVYQTMDNKYIIQRAAVSPRSSRVFVEEGARYHILHLLSIEPGKYTVEELGRLINVKLKTSSEEFVHIINEMITQGFIKMSPEGKVYSAAFPPPEKQK
jgi:hypothetical protein